MNEREVTILAERVEREFLPFVRRPSRYIGGEINQIKKDLTQCSLTVALCFPDIYEVAMSYTGLTIIYDILNRIEGAAGHFNFRDYPDVSIGGIVYDLPDIILGVETAVAFAIKLPGFVTQVARERLIPPAPSGTWA